MKTYSRAIAVLRVAGAVAAGAPEGGERREEGMLHRGRRLRRPPELRELVEDDRELQHGRVASLPDFAIACEAEERLEQHLGLERRPRREASADRRVLRREDAMLRRDRHVFDVA